MPSFPFASAIRRVATRTALVAAALLALSTTTKAQSTRSFGLAGSGLTAAQEAEVIAARAEAKAAFDAVERGRTGANLPLTASQRATLRQASERQLARIRAALTPAQRVGFEQRLAAAREAHEAQRQQRMAAFPAPSETERPKPVAGQRQETKAGPPPAARPDGDESASESMSDAAGAQ